MFQKILRVTIAMSLAAQVALEVVNQAHSVTSGMSILAAIFSIFVYQPNPAQAITTEKFLLLLGVLGRCAEDLHKTFGPSSCQPAPTPQALPTKEPINPFNPTPTNQPTEFN